jgi:hypothetical protein
VHAPAQRLHAAARGGAQPIVQSIDPRAEIVFRRHDELRGCGGSWRAEIGDEIGHREVGFVADRRDHGNRRRGNRARHDFAVERPEVLDRSAAAADDDDVDAFHAADRPQPLRDFGGGALALDARRPDDQMGVGISATEHFDDVLHRRAVERGDDADLARKRGQRTLPRCIEQSFGFEPFLQLLEGELASAEPLRLEMLADQLILAFRLVHGHFAARDDPQTVHGFELQITERRSEDDTSDLCRSILQREVQMARVPDAAVGQLALHPHFEQFRLEQIADADSELRHAQDPARRHGLWSLVVGG